MIPECPQCGSRDANYERTSHDDTIDWWHCQDCKVHYSVIALDNHNDNQ